MEEWKDVPRYEGIYQVSNFGRVKSLERYRVGNMGSPTLVKEKILKPKVDRYGYFVSTLSKDGKMNCFTIHRLVAMTFVPNKNVDLFTQVNHIDGNKKNNICSNLEWCDGKHNMQEAIRLGLRGGKPYNPRIDSIPINQFDNNGILIKNYVNLAEASRETGILKSSLSNCLNGRSKSSGGFIWEYDL